MSRVHRLFLAISVISIAASLHATTPFTHPAFSGDGLLLLSRDDGSGVYVYEPALQRLTTLTTDPSSGYATTLAPDGSKVGFKTFVRNGAGALLQAANVFDTKTRTTTAITPPLPLVGVPSFSLDGKTVFSIGETLVVLAADGSVSRFPLGNYANLTPVSPDGALVAFNDRDEAIRILDLRDGGTRVITPAGASWFWPQWSPDGSRLAVSTTGAELSVYDLRSGILHQLGPAMRPVWSPDGESLLFTRPEGNAIEGIHGYETVSSSWDGQRQQIQMRTPAGAIIPEIAVSASGQVAYAGGDGILQRGRFRDGELTLSDRLEVPAESVKFGAAKSSASRAAGDGDIESFLPAAVTSVPGVPYIHQVYDTPNWFNGNGACGAASAMMAITFYGLLPYWDTTVSAPYSHTSHYGRYVSDVYTFNGHTWNVMSPDESGNPAWGAYGYIYQNNLENTKNHMAELLAAHGLDNVPVDWTHAWSSLQTETDASRPVVVLNQLTTVGHYIVAMGYISGQHTGYFNDPYGNANLTPYKAYNGAGVYYDWPGYNNGYHNLNTVYCFIYARRSTQTCTSFTIDPSYANPTADAGSQPVTVTGSPSGCQGGSWSTTGNGSWLTVTPPTGSGSGQATVQWSQNPNTTSRSSSVTIANRTFSVTQAGTSQGCTSYSLYPTGIYPTADAGSRSVSVTANPSGCQSNWTASGNGSWISVSSGGGTGSGSVTVSWMQNPYTSPRDDYATIAGIQWWVHQGPASALCSYSLGATSVDLLTGTGSGNFTLTGSPAGCSGSWSASSDSTTWLTLSGATTGNGPGTFAISFDFQTNPNPTPRTGHLNFSGNFPGGAIVTINQSAGGRPNIAPYQPAGWSDSLTIRKGSGAPGTNGSSFTSSDSLYADSAVVNNGPATSPPVNVDVLVDGIRVLTWTTATMGANGTAQQTSIPLGKLTSGAHTITLLCDSNGIAVESNELDNRYSKTIRVGFAPINVALGDFNADHKADVLWRIDGSGLDAMWLMDGPAKSVGSYLETAPSRWIVAGVGDFDGDGRADILWRDPVTGENAIWLMNGTTKTLGTYIEPAGPQWVVAGIGDFNGDHKADILWRNLSSGEDAMWLMNGTTKSLGTYIESAGPQWSVAGIGDFNADGKADVLWRNDVTGEDAMWLMNGPTKAVGSYIEPASSRWRIVGVGDFDADGHADILWRDPVSGENAMWLMNGTTKVLGTYIEGAPPQWNVAGVGDLNGDGRADVFWRDNLGQDSVWLMNGTIKAAGAYTEAASLPWCVVP